jgi:hypothetical protein
MTHRPFPPSTPASRRVQAHLPGPGGVFTPVDSLQSVQAALYALLSGPPAKGPLVRGHGLDLEAFQGRASPQLAKRLREEVGRLVRQWEPRAEQLTVSTEEVDDGLLTSFRVRLRYSVEGAKDELTLHMSPGRFEP